jgi:hypothetical protein
MFIFTRKQRAQHSTGYAGTIRETAGCAGPGTNLRRFSAQLLLPIRDAAAASEPALFAEPYPSLAKAKKKPVWGVK